MANKEKVEIKRSDQFQEVDDELTRAMADLDSTIERVSLIFQSGDDPAASEAPRDDAAGTGEDTVPPEVESDSPSDARDDAGANPPVRTRKGGR